MADNYQDFVPEFGQERAIGERMDYTQEADEFMKIDDLGKLYSILYERKQANFDAYFPIILTIVSQKLFEAKITPYKIDSIELMKYTHLLENKENVNPVLFIIGYIVSDKGKKTIRDDMLKTMFKNWINIPYPNINKEGVIRYVRWWNFQVGNMKVDFRVI